MPVWSSTGSQGQRRTVHPPISKSCQDHTLQTIDSRVMNRDPNPIPLSRVPPLVLLIQNGVTVVSFEIRPQVFVVDS